MGFQLQLWFCWFWRTTRPLSWRSCRNGSGSHYHYISFNNPVQSDPENLNPIWISGSGQDWVSNGAAVWTYDQLFSAPVGNNAACETVPERYQSVTGPTSQQRTQFLWNNWILCHSAASAEQCFWVLPEPERLHLKARVLEVHYREAGSGTMRLREQQLRAEDFQADCDPSAQDKED